MIKWVWGAGNENDQWSLIRRCSSGSHSFSRYCVDNSQIKSNVTLVYETAPLNADSSHLLFSLNSPTPHAYKVFNVLGATKAHLALHLHVRQGFRIYLRKDHLCTLFDSKNYRFNFLKLQFHMFFPSFGRWAIRFNFPHLWKYKLVSENT